MYEFLYEGFDFLQKFQVELPSKIFVIENSDDFEFYYAEGNVMFTAHMTKNEIWVKMVEKYGPMEKDAAISLFRQTQFKDITEPLSVKKDIEEVEGPQGSKEIIQLKTKKLKNMKFTAI